MEPKMKVGDLVRLSSEEVNNLASEERDQVHWFGIVIDTVSCDGIGDGVVVYWTKEWPRTLEYARHLEVV
jgi:hypothetical protein